MKRCQTCNKAMPSDPKGRRLDPVNLGEIQPTECAECRNAGDGAEKAERTALEAQVLATLKDDIDPAIAIHGLETAEGEADRRKAIVEDAKRVQKAQEELQRKLAPQVREVLKDEGGIK